MPHVTVAIPWRDTTCGWRRMNKAKVAGHWRGWDVAWLDDGSQPFSRARSLNLAADEPWDVLVIADADVLISHDQVRQAIDLALLAPGMVLAYDVYRYLGTSTTKKIWANYGGDWTPGVRWEMPGTVSSCLAVSRTTWDAVGGFDPRFTGWGFEDNAFERSCRTLAGETRRIPGPVWHLWHPVDPTNDQAAPTYQANQALDQRYAAAEGDRAAMADLIAER